MSSLHLSKILSTKKSTAGAEYDLSQKIQTVSISKALNPSESPLKVKHARAAIISTHKTHECHSFWAAVLRQPLMENRFTDWKFCHMLHKVLREGHVNCIKHSLRNKQALIDMGKHWGYLTDGLGVCIEAYTKLLVTKLEFHDKNPTFPGNLLVNFNELERVAQNDINFYFQLGVEIFDYLDDIILLQGKVFQSVNTFPMSSMTPQGQCRLAPLIPLIQDSNQLYDFSVRLMFKLHGHLPNDILSGHRERFRTLFNQLKIFYETVRPLQYFYDLIQVPRLPENAPNFSSKIDFGSYVPPVVVVPEPPPDPEPVIANLVDMSPNEEIQPSQGHNNLDRILLDRDNLIRQLHLEIERLHEVIKSSEISHKNQIKILEDQLSKFNYELSVRDEEMLNMKQINDDLERKVLITPSLQEKATAEEEKAKANEEKFQKIKTLYTQIRDEHVKLLRQHGEVNKQLAITKKETTDLSTENELLKVQLEEYQQNKSQHEILLSNSVKFEENEKLLQAKYEELVEKNEELKSKFDNLQVDKSAEIIQLQTLTESLKNQIDQINSEHQIEINNLTNNFERQSKEYSELLETFKENTEEKNIEIENLKQAIVENESKCNVLVSKSDKIEENEKLLQTKYEELLEKNEQLQCKYNELETNKSSEIASVQLFADNLKANTDQIISDNQKEIEKLSLNLETKTREYLELTDSFNKNKEETQTEIAVLKQSIEENENKYKNTLTLLERVSDEKMKGENDLHDLLHQQAELDEHYRNAKERIALLESALQDSEIRGKTSLRALLEASINSSEKLALRAMNENEFTHVTGSSSYFMMLAEELQETLNELKIVYLQYIDDNSRVEGLARKIVLTGHLLATIQTQGMTICNTSAYIECGEKIAGEIKHFSNDVMGLFETLKTLSKPNEIEPKISNVKDKLSEITNMLHDLCKKSDSSGQIGDLVESELASMDKAIEEAAEKIVEMLSNSRAHDSGVKLEVNERILDACTSLMQCIRILVQKSKVLQAEIIALGRGTASEKEFYKRNHQWTEGLISASKSVATGANLLVTAANRAVSGESKHHLDIIVAAQEIAACTAQLVVASRVKAPRDSRNLSELSKASRNVTQATGAVVATAKDCSQQLEETQDFDLTILTIHQAKTLEMEIQVKVIELEQALQTERLRLAAFRRNNYQNSGDHK